MIDSPRLSEADTTAALRTVLVSDLAGWRSFEVFGPPGSGKSHVCSRAACAIDALTMCDRQAVIYYAALDLPRATRLAERLLRGRRLKNYYGVWLRVQYARYWRNADAAARQYLESVRRVRDAFPLPAAARKRFDNRVLGSGAFLERARNAGQRLIIDEGLLNQLNALIARSAGDCVDDARTALVHECLVMYPWEKSALLIEASPQTCVTRQIARRHVLFTDDRPQEIFHAVAERLLGLCQDAGWRVARFRND